MGAENRSGWLFAAIQHPLPHHLLSRLWLRITRIRVAWFKNRLIHWFIRHFEINIDEAADPDPNHYPHLNAFFTRPLREGARPQPEEPLQLVSPVDGCISQIGPLQGDSLLQAKGHSYSATALLADGELAERYRDGLFTTLYLSPRDYHRIHMPLAGRLREMWHIPGRLFSVNATTTEMVPGLFARNERVVCHFDSEQGPFAMVLVGAMLVGSIETVWHGEVTPPSRSGPVRWCYDADEAPQFVRGDEMGRFNMGSTVILLLPPGMAEWRAELQSGTALRMGEAMALLQLPATKL